MAVIGINYDGGTYYDDEGDDLKKVGEPPINVSIYVHSGDDKYEFKSGDFVKDWYDMMKKIIHEEIKSDTGFWSHSSSVYHFIMDGAPYDSAYLHIVDGKGVLKYYDRTDPNWWMDNEIGKGSEFFVLEDTKPTWEELRKMCGDEKKI
jgi:hypothetical protein